MQRTVRAMTTDPAAPAAITSSTAFRSLREAVRPSISLRELARRTGINSGRLSIIERGVEPTEVERSTILSELGKLIGAVDVEIPRP